MNQKLKEWLTKLLTSSTKVSSKRIIAIFVVTNLLIICYIATFTTYLCPIEMFDTLAILAGSLFGGTVIEKFSKQNGNNTENHSENNS